MKKKSLLLVSILILSLFVSIFCFSGCNPEDTDNGINIIMPDGAPALAMAKLINDKPTIDGLKTNYNIIADPSTIPAKILNGDADAAILPINLAAKLYSQGADIKLITLNTFGNLYIIGKTEAEITSLEDLKGKVLYSIGQGAVPSLTLKFLLKQNGIECVENKEIDENNKEEIKAIEGKVAIQYVSEGTGVIGKLESGQATFGLLGEPAVTAACKKIKGTKVLLDMQKLYNEATDTEGGMPQAALVVSNKLIESNPNFVTEIVEKLKENVKWVNENHDKISKVMLDNGSQIKAPYTKQTIENCNIVVKLANENKKEIELCLNSLTDGKMPLPDNDFYYVAKEK